MRLKLSHHMRTALLGISELDGPAPTTCDGSCRTLVEIFGRRYCVKHHAHPNTLDALERRGLLEWTPSEAQLPLPGHTAKKLAIQLTPKGQRVTTLLRLGRMK